jgi:hypothetical protein
MLKILLFPLLFCLAFAAHPFYLSVCDLKYNGSEKTIQGTVKIFTGDLEEALARLNNKRTDLINSHDEPGTRVTLAAYLKKHLTISVNGSPLEINVLGYETEEEAVWMYVEIKNCPKPRNILIDNKILCDYIPQQMNIVHIQVDKVQKSLKASCEETQMAFQF